MFKLVAFSISNCNIADLRLSFEERKQIINWYWKFENVAAVRRQWRLEYATEPPSRLTMTRLRDTFEIHGTVCDVHKGRSGRPRTGTSDESTTAVLELFQRSPQISSRQVARESDVSASSVLLRKEIQAVCTETLVRCTESVLSNVLMLKDTSLDISHINHIYFSNWTLSLPCPEI
ncbi:Protein of unknown function DUF4817 [Biomphalaria glabrata]|nr:Protein of unknown function DUF4817 [Biomphalaria glabrata]